METIYQKTQYGIFAVVIILLSLFITIGFLYQLGSKPLPLISYIFIICVFLIILLLFYKLEIRIDKEKITAIFGIGLLKREFLIQEIDTIESYKIPWYVGIGIRITQRGTLWNVATGKAILLNSKGQTKTFLVGSAEVEEIIKILNNKIK